MVRWFLRAVAAVAGLALAAFGALVVVMRTKWEPGLRFVTRLQRRYARKAGLRLAGRPGDVAVVVHHVGRRSGRSYATPVTVEETSAGLLVTLPYGPGTDWARNVLAADRAVLTIDGESVEVTAPRVIGLDEAAPLLSPRERRVARFFGATDFLLLRPADSSA
ncbi:deazaflavin-dependent oxidoreductase (nitroreductase family) [Isoptericola jiangsuensis]|uniref:Deazaflavin-dependent oxidoreductase (Nitroreductase family) n=1 Tax=Isoptericola jiangsuensis TaxID=548579 RepID=A0A2A9ETF2_9MICO|nr:nitroreductase family deazaflavin-dependent oxidoreductase [Isoptericola jiangsuensis]PFG41542.1 deazaflavin-dependent oxidoreductase (nitroreductase family) [Isoptericola jiangsuensis]